MSALAGGVIALGVGCLLLARSPRPTAPLKVEVETVQAGAGATNSTDPKLQQAYQDLDGAYRQIEQLQAAQQAAPREGHRKHKRHHAEEHGDD